MQIVPLLISNLKPLDQPWPGQGGPMTPVLHVSVVVLSRQQWQCYRQFLWENLESHGWEGWQNTKLEHYSSSIRTQNSSTTSAEQIISVLQKQNTSLQYYRSRTRHCSTTKAEYIIAVLQKQKTSLQYYSIMFRVKARIIKFQYISIAWKGNRLF